MRPSYILLVVAAVVVGGCNSIVQSKHLTMKVSDELKPVDAVLTDSYGRRFLRSQNDGIEDEERMLNFKNLLGLQNVRNDFAKADLDQMLKSKSFKLSMFKKWDGHTDDQVIKAVKVNKKKNAKYRHIMVEYLNNYRGKNN